MTATNTPSGDDDLVGQDLLLERQLFLALSVAFRTAVIASKPVLQELNLTHPQYPVMLTLWDGGAMVSFATELGAILVAEGIETDMELSTVTEVGMNAGQGYLLGRPSVRAEDWSRWQGGHPGGGHVDVHHS
jgi:hypothetical protein